MDFERFGIRKVELSGKQSELIEKLKIIKGEALVDRIIESVQYGFLKEAKTLCWNEADKFRSQPEVIEILSTYLFDADEKVPWSSSRKKKNNMERESGHSSIEEKFARQIDDRLDLWISIIDDSDVSKETKDGIKKRLLHFQRGAFTEWSGIDVAVYGTISSILTLTERDKDKEEAKALFENIRDDIYDLVKKIKS